MADSEKDKETLRIDRTGRDPEKTEPAARSAKLDGSSDDVTVPAAKPVKVDGSQDPTAPAARPVEVASSSEDPTAPAAQPVKVASSSDDQTAPAAKPLALDKPVRSDDVTSPAAPRRKTTPRRRTLLWITAGLLLVWAAFVLPGAARPLRARYFPPETNAAQSVVEDVELPPDPPLSEEVRAAMRLGREAEDAMRLAAARKHYHRALTLERKCSSCALRLVVVERRIEAFGFQALADGERYLAEARYEEAAKSYQKVLDLVPDEKARFNTLAKAGLADARKAAKKAGRPIP